MSKRTVVKKDESKVVGILYFCDILKKEILLKDVEHALSSSEGECELCGSHGDITLHVNKCECGKTHSIEIKSW